MNDEAANVLSLPEAPDAIELRHLRSFVAVAEELNFSRAATRLYLSQPALSRQIRSLERLVGCALFRRSTHQVELTIAGNAFLDRARRLLEDVADAVAVARSVGGELAARANRYWEACGGLAGTDPGLEEMSEAYERLLGQFSLPPEVTLRPVNAGGVPSFLVAPRRECAPAVLYLHGGGYVMGSAFGYRPLAGALAGAADAGVLLPEYRLAPEYPFPAALEDALRAYLWILDHGTPPEQVTVSGDSSGAGLVLSLLIELKQQDLPLPAGAALFCPWVDLTRPGEAESPSDPVIAATAAQIRRYTGYYLAGHPDDDPLVSPLTADLSGLPPMLIQASTGDALVGDARRLVEHARAHGVDARLELFPVDAHAFQLFWSFLPEAADAIDQAGRFTKRSHSPVAETRHG